MSIFIFILILICLLLLSAFFSLSETALFSIPAHLKKTYKTSSNKNEKIAYILLDKPKSLLVTLLIMNIAVNLGVQNVISSIFGIVSGFFVSVVLPFALTLVFGEILPKIIAVSKNRSIVKKISSVIYFLTIIATPIHYLFLKLSKIASKVFAIFFSREKEISVEEIKHALSESKDSGLISKDEVKLLRGSLRLSDMSVKEVMCPRQSIIFYDINDPIESLIKIFLEKRASKLIVVNKDIDTIIGVLHVSSFFLNRELINRGLDLENHLHKPFYVPESMLTRSLLAYFDEKKISIALLVNEYGSVSGLITKEDLVEIVVGQIKDDRDNKPLFTKQSDDAIICSGSINLSDLEQIFDIEIKKIGSATTACGYLLEILEDIPKSGYKLEKDNLLFHVLLATDSYISSLYIKRLKKGKEG